MWNFVFQIKVILIGQIVLIVVGFCYGIKISVYFLLCLNVFDEEESKVNCVIGGVVNVIDGDWFYFLDYYVSEKYRWYCYFLQVIVCFVIFLKILLLIW